MVQFVKLNGPEFFRENRPIDPDRHAERGGRQDLPYQTFPTGSGQPSSSGTYGSGGQGCQCRAGLPDAGRAGIHGRIVERALAEEQIGAAFVRVAGESRLCIAVIDPLAGTQTEINEQGPEISRQAYQKL